MRAVDERDAYANLLTPRLLRERGLKGRDAALATELAYGTLRGLGTYDAIIAICSDRAPDPAVHDALRLGAHQLLRMRVPPHAAVGTTVDLVRQRVGPGAAKFANAVLRKIASRTLDEWLPIVAPDLADDPSGHLAVVHSHPRWVVSAFRDALGSGIEETAELLAADNARPLVTLVARPGRSSRRELLDAGAEPTRYSPYGAYLAEGDPGQIAAIAETRAAVQDEASQLVALALTRVPLGPPASPRPGSAEGELWLDMCAGPGGKAGLLDAVAVYGDTAYGDGDTAYGGQAVPSAEDAGGGGSVSEGGRSVPSHEGAEGGRPLSQVAEGGPVREGAGGGRPVAFPGGARLLAADVQQHRARLVAQTTAHAGVITADGTRPAWRPGAFDRVMLDAPCTGLGALRRRPEARWRRDPASVAELGRLQRSLLNTALDATRPGGVVAYVTCSPHLAETRVVVGDVIARRDDVEQLDARDYLPEVDGLGDGPHAQFWPHRHGTDAMFLALLRKRA
ncbi:transcription antitermination factor NusB [Nonomuraea roseoviolacea subsp. carminata]|uniref:16S rRNA (Cytosine967-C5)-methyltransferase n=1 Tax=Nonomuraea roseoviolacea subsp. carminata TaxID=160689 RepID=A0ABT1JRF7_9ACTN|nr:transcription antitermination factor NusB [Nonomuraea roseoviolacea]MCP2344336.1 16S rRNA (cytosine967-C5)-methyltransferase [Nonomuraea roseoviolacea subsp. carminata]